MAIKSWLSHPLTRGLELDDPATTQLRRRIIQQKAFLKRIYQAWYQELADCLPAIEGPALELGSGAGFLAECLPGLLTSEVFYCPGVRLVLDGRQLPFADQTLRAIVMTDVFHHIPAVQRFLREAGRCVRPGGIIAMIEPWMTPWSRWVYKHLHHEPCNPQARDWEFTSSGPLSGANEALAWIVFSRDCRRFSSEFPEWEIKTIRPMMPFCYLASGGVTTRSLMPGWSFALWRGLETALDPWKEKLAMFALILLQRNEKI